MATHLTAIGSQRSSSSSSNASSNPWTNVTAGSSRPSTTQSRSSSTARSSTEKPIPSIRTIQQDQHPLKQDWELSYTHRAPQQKVTDEDWEANIRSIAVFRSIGAFWRIFSRIRRPSEASPVFEYQLFRKGIRPLWEDEANAHGGKLILRLKKGVADRLWEEVVMAIIGETLLDDSVEFNETRKFRQKSDEDYGSEEYLNDVCGCTLSVRKDEDILSIWNRDTQKRDRLREAVIRILCLQHNSKTNLNYKSHQQSVKRLKPRELGVQQQ